MLSTVALSLRSLNCACWFCYSVPENVFKCTFPGLGNKMWMKEVLFPWVHTLGSVKASTHGESQRKLLTCLRIRMTHSGDSLNKLFYTDYDRLSILFCASGWQAKFCVSGVGVGWTESHPCKAGHTEVPCVGLTGGMPGNFFEGNSRLCISRGWDHTWQNSSFCSFLHHEGKTLSNAHANFFAVHITPRVPLPGGGEKKTTQKWNV